MARFRLWPENRVVLDLEQVLSLMEKKGLQFEVFEGRIRVRHVTIEKDHPPIELCELYEGTPIVAIPTASEWTLFFEKDI